MTMTSSEFGLFLSDLVKQGRLTEKEQLDIEYTCADLQTRQGKESLNKFIDKMVRELRV